MGKADKDEVLKGKGANSVTQKKMSSVPRLLTGVFVALALLTNCATTDSYVPAPRVPLGVTVEGPVDRYLVEVSYITQDDIGVPTDYRGIRGQVIHAMVDGKDYYKWESYEIRAYRPGAAMPSFESYPPAIGFEYLRNGQLEPDMTTIADTSSLPRTMDGFDFYVNLIDFHTWDVYRDMFFGDNEDALIEPGDSREFDLTKKELSIGSWENITRDFQMTAGIIYGEYIGDVVESGTEYKVLFFRQEQTISQTVTGLGMDMPYAGTNRFNGHMYLYTDGTLARGNLREYVYGKVYAPMNQTVIVHTERHYSIRRVR